MEFSTVKIRTTITSAPSYFVTPLEHPLKMAVWHEAVVQLVRKVGKFHRNFPELISFVAEWNNAWTVKWDRSTCAVQTFGSGAAHPPAGFSIVIQWGQRMIIIYILGVDVGIQDGFDTNHLNWSEPHLLPRINVAAYIQHKLKITKAVWAGNKNIQLYHNLTWFHPYITSCCSI